MTEARIADVFASSAAHRLEIIRIAGRLAERAAEMAGCDAGPMVDRWADDTRADAQSLAAGIEAFTERMDAAQDETQPISREEIAAANAEDDEP